MTLKAGSSLGPYEIVGPLGAGGMGEVYRARDQRLAREVAIKVLPTSFLGESERLRRFEQEARAAGQLNHPNILVVYDIGAHDGTPYVVEELLEGETLRQKMGGAALPTRKAIDYGGQIAQGLAAAHQKGIVHRDLKPENLFVTHDGRVKILDFGLAKLTSATPFASASQMSAAPTEVETGAGVVMGTVGYMSPEQVRGQPADHRSDIFSFGAVLYEMISGQRAFQRDSSVETMNAILKEDPPEISVTRVDLPPGLERVVQHCLEKSPDERFQSARDLAFQIHELSSPTAVTSGRIGIATAPRAIRTRPLIAAAVVVAAVAAGVFAGRLTVRPPATVAYQQVTFRQGYISSGRFTPDGETILYSASWDGNAKEIFTSRLGSPEARPLGISPADLLSVSASGELAVLLRPRYTFGFQRSGTLARVPLAGGTPREILEHVQDADWAPNGSDLAVIREVEGRYRLEYPVGKVLYQTATWIGSLRVSRDGRRIGFVDHPLSGDSRGHIAVVDLSGSKKNLTAPFSSSNGLAWSADGKELWFTASRTGNRDDLYAVDMSGHERLISSSPASVELFDVGAGRVLVTRNSWRRGMVALVRGETVERDLSWLDWSRPGDISADGRTVLFEEQGQGGGPNYSVYVRKTDGSPAVKLGEGFSLSLSPDGRWAATTPIDPTDRIVFLPTGAGETKTLMLPGLSMGAADWHPDGRRLLITAAEPDRFPRLYVVDMAGGAPKPLTGEEAKLNGVVSPDGKWVAASSDSGGRLIPFEGGEGRPLPGIEPGDWVFGWSSDGRGVYVRPREADPPRIDRIDIDTGKRSLVRTLVPADKAGLIDVGYPAISPDGESSVYSYRRNLATLYVGTGLR